LRVVFVKKEEEEAKQHVPNEIVSKTHRILRVPAAQKP
jgi:hypothetical protein